jgi:hypothetical protein
MVSSHFQPLTMVTAVQSRSNSRIKFMDGGGSTIQDSDHMAFQLII